jgi:tetratricopeptide (TPR) repeat protein
MDKNLERLKALDRAEILNISSNTLGDYELLDLAAYFQDDAQDEDRGMAVFELILRSPLNDDEMVAYGEIYLDLINYYQRQKNFPSMLYWAAAHIAYDEQNDRDPFNLLNSWRDLAEAYLNAGEINSGLGIFTRLITRYPGDVWNYNILGLTLPNIGLNRLAIETLDRGLALIAREDPENLRKQFQELQQKAQASLANGQDLTGHVAPDILNAFRAALSLPDGQSPDEKEPLAHRNPLDRLISLERQGDRLLDEEILKQGRVLIPELIHLGMDEALMKRSLGPWHAARLLNELRSGVAPELEALANWLDRTSAEDWQPWMGAKKYGKIGGYTYAELESLTRDPRNGDIIRESVIRELVERASQQPLLRSKLILLIRDLLNREAADQASEETFTAQLISSAVDLEAKELLPDIQRAYAEDRVDQQIIDEAFTYEKLGIPAPTRPPRRTDGLYLRLECAVCGRTREHFTRFVIMDQTTLDSEDQSKRSPYILDHEVICPKCGAVEQYRLQPFETMKLMQWNPGQIASMLSKQKPAKPPIPDPHVFMVRGEAFGRPMHPLDTIDEYRRRIALDPQNGELYMRLGNTLRFIGRYEPALEVYRKAVELTPDDPDILFPAATAEHDFGDQEAARRLYERCVAQGKNSLDILRGGLHENIVNAMNGLRALNKGEMSPWNYQLKNANGQPLMPPERQMAGQPMKKDKRAKRHKK